MRSTKDEKKEITYSLQRIKIQERKKTWELRNKNVISFYLEIIQTVVYLLFISSGKQLFYLKKIKK